MFTRLTLGATGAMANADHLLGAIILTVTVTATAEVGRAVRFAIIPLGLALFATPFMFAAGWTATLGSIGCGAALILLSLRRGPVRNGYGASEVLIR